MSLETQSVDDLGRELGDAIASLPEYQAFEEAKAAVQEDEDLQEQIESFEQQRQDFMVRQQVGEASQEDLESVQEAQEELHSNPKMAEFLEAKEELVDTLEDVNRAISDPLAVDFGGEAGGCCHD